MPNSRQKAKQATTGTLDHFINANNLATALFTRFQTLGSEEEFGEAIDLLRDDGKRKRQLAIQMSTPWCKIFG